MATRSTALRCHARAGSESTPTFHSFQNNGRHSRRDEVDDRPTASPMVRQDSGYESSRSAPRPSTSSKRHRNSSRTPSSSPRSNRPQQRPSPRRSGTGNPVARMPGRSSRTISRPSFLTPQQQDNLAHKNSYFQFPAPENLEQHDAPPESPSVDLAPVILQVNTANLRPPSSRSPWPRAPAATTHSWDPDRTRQLEHAAIDAARRGVRGWLLRRVVPECLVPRGTCRGAFADDGGSVRRYRLELDIECPGESVPPSPAGAQLRGFRARVARRSWWARLKRCAS